MISIRLSLARLSNRSNDRAPRLCGSRNAKCNPYRFKSCSIFGIAKLAMGIRDRPISPGSPWQNGYAERLIGTMRRECLDRLLIFGESHLRQVLASYAAYYNQMCTHLA